MSGFNGPKKNVYVYELPYAERKQFCSIIDMNDKWEDLGGKYMKFDCATLFKIGKAFMRNHSPTDELLNLWGEQNHTVLELFILLSEMQHFQAMGILKPFVDKKYHKLIYQGDQNFSNLVNTTSSNHNYSRTDDNHITLNSNSLKKKNYVNLNQQYINVNDERIEKNLDPSTMLSSAEACTPLITYDELGKATNNWNKTNILGKGGFGVVFKGIWKNTAVAIKRLEAQKGAEQEFNVLEAQRQQSLRELKYLNSCRHDNVLSLYGFSIGGEKPCLVYQYMPNGSLEDRLQCRQGTKPLTWSQRYKIATGSARGLQFLHSMVLIHGDIKSANILLDPYFEPRIGDFGLAREGPLQQYTHVKVSHVHGTRPYLPDEFLRGKKFSTKVDTFSFGVVLFEIATGQRAYDSSRKDKFLKEYVENYDNSIELIDTKAGPDDSNMFPCFISLGKNCVSYRPKDRPDMEQVLKQFDIIMLQEKQQCTVRHNSIPTNHLELQMRKLSIPSGSYHPQAWLFSPVPSNQLLKQNSSPAPHYAAATAVTTPDQVDVVVMPLIEERDKHSIKSSSSPTSVEFTIGTPNVPFINVSLSETKSLCESKNKFSESKLQTIDSELQSSNKESKVNFDEKYFSSRSS
ncbi:serine/threonine-protein kinase pelle-like isoform X2 [Daktulosphaira vitifoliae]|uniref:serine/threonine-protein kinase pelle-like isoform X2 n=1 Tax=Daktulosphaira vitifoliae TaxID=58002 RepID=UPI0021A9F6EB|nr:serine/threonine-protein kinase pelle-like isoform X2 [Daktulosphaira vitifoliae]